MWINASHRACQRGSDQHLELMNENIHSARHTFSPTAVFWMRAWLVLLGVLVYAMILVGGATRLTDSGLSITEWKPISGALPPISQDDWKALFELYKQTAEYKFQNAGMSLQEFEFIYWWEWSHRFLGRFVGLVAVAGLIAFAAKGWLKNGLVWKFLFLIFLGGLQGAIGWWMVASGIGETTRVDVAPYRLMTHFCLALVIICYTVWLWMDFSDGASKGAKQKNTIVIGFFLLVFLQMAAGALVAGLDAGRTYTDWPLMDGDVVPVGYWSLEMGVRNLFENVATTQFNHRMVAYLICVVAAVMFVIRRGSIRKDGLMPVFILVGLQIVWGIGTLLMAAPLPLALIHQGLGVLVLLAALRAVKRSGRSYSSAS